MSPDPPGRGPGSFERRCSAIVEISIYTSSRARCANGRSYKGGTVYQSMEQSVPMRRIGEPHEFANLVTFLASELSSYINGVNIPIDGGLLKSL